MMTPGNDFIVPCPQFRADALGERGPGSLIAGVFTLPVLMMSYFYKTVCHLKVPKQERS